MGIECTLKELNRVWNLNSHYPIITMLEKDLIIKRFKEFQTISIGRILSDALIDYNKNIRKAHVIEELDKIINSLKTKNIIICDIDMLFNPEYSIDIPGYFIKIARNRKIIVLWPGEYFSASFIYASPEHKDYKKYPIKDYDILYLKY